MPASGLGTMDQGQHQGIADERDAADGFDSHRHLRPGWHPWHHFVHRVANRQQPEAILGSQQLQTDCTSCCISSSFPAVPLVSRKSVTSMGTDSIETASIVCGTPLSVSVKSEAVEVGDGSVAALDRER